MELFSNDYVTISIDESIPCLEWIGKKFISSEAFRESEEKSLSFYREYVGKYSNLQWYVDARKVGAISHNDTEWVAKTILPHFAQLGLKKEAFVVPESAFGKVAINDYKSESGDTIKIEVFDSELKAKTWLREG
jgi:hypothetical protein